VPCVVDRAGHVLVRRAGYCRRAQSPAGEENGIGTGEIIVTAQKRAQNLQDVPLAISVVSGAQLERANVNSAEQLFQRVPTLTFRKGNTNKDLGAVDPRRWHHLVRFGRRTFGFDRDRRRGFARTGQQTSDFLDVERIEVLRGPQGSLFGKNASAGVINIITRDPPEGVRRLSGCGLVRRQRIPRARQRRRGAGRRTDGLADRLLRQV
jgi:iron complex outermembrane receptor protein